jgi:hypothetical protein
MKTKKIIAQKHIYQYRSNTYRFNPESRLYSIKDAVNFVNKRGFVFFWPITGIEMPSLWCAVAGDRPVPNNHDDPGHITWRWKDSLLGKKKWYYAKILHRKSTIISLKLIPYFFALSQSVHEGLGDLTFLYQQGKISVEEKQIYQALTISNPLDTITLRSHSNLAASGSASRFNRALELLQRDFRIMPSGISHNGGWNYAYYYQTVQNEFPELIEQSKRIKKEDAFNTILYSYFRSNGTGTYKEIQKLFGWHEHDIHKTINSLITVGEIIQVFTDESKGKDIFAIPELL